MGGDCDCWAQPKVTKLRWRGVEPWEVVVGAEHNAPLVTVHYSTA